jgi:hypothetical protein
MKKIIAGLKNSRFYFFLYTIKSAILYYYYYFRNRKVSYFDYKRLSVEYPMFSFSRNPGKIGNKCYGNLWAVKNALGTRFDKKCIIEHGLYFGEYVLLNDLKIETPNVIYTFGNYRKRVLESCDHDLLSGVKIETVGPYIKYVDNFYSYSEINELRNKYGKVLLVFPKHATPELRVDYDVEAFLEEIELMAINFDAVFVSLFWLDVVNGRYKDYENRGFIIVSSGTRNDPRFLSRLKDLIDISAMTMSNDIGTHIGYSVTLNKPHYYFSQEISRSVVDGENYHFNEQRMAKIAQEKKLFSSVFGSRECLINEEQRKLVEFYWGN